MNKITAKINVPRCWQKLVEMDFPEDLDGILSEKEDHKGIADFRPHYDDYREASGQFDNGDELKLCLSSGQSNYFGGCIISSKNGDFIYESINSGDVFEDFGDEEIIDVEVEGEKREYVIQINWT